CRSARACACTESRRARSSRNRRGRRLRRAVHHHRSAYSDRSWRVEIASYDVSFACGRLGCPCRSRRLTYGRTGPICYVSEATLAFAEKIESMNTPFRRALTLALLLLPAGAFAHPGHEASTFVQGFAHPLGGID